MEKQPAGFSRLLAYWWAFWVALALLEAFTPFRFSHVVMRSWVRCAAWLPAVYFIWKGRPRLLRVLAGLQLGLVLAYGMAGLALAGANVYADFFFKSGDPDYDAAYDGLDMALLRSGSRRIYHRGVYHHRKRGEFYNPDDYNKLVVARTLLPGLIWQQVLPDTARLDRSWTVLDSVMLEVSVPRPRLRTLMPVGWRSPSGTVAVAVPPAPATPPPPPHYAFERRTANRPREQVYSVADQEPALPSGSGRAAVEAAIRQRLGPLPPAADSGKVLVAFVVLRSGLIGEVKVIRSVGPDADATVLAALDALPPFVPGKYGGQPVAVAYTVQVPVAPPRSR